MARTVPPGGAERDFFRTVVTTLEQGVLLVDGSGIVLAANPAAEAILGFEATLVCGGADVPWVWVDETGQPVAFADLPCQRSLATGEPQKATLGLIRNDGRHAWVEVGARPTLSAGTPVAVLSLTDVTEQRAEQRRLLDLAERDTLTGLFNRRYFDVALRRTLERCRDVGDPAVLLLIDLDGLKGVNDSLGHAAGDALLRDAARRLSAELRISDVLARYGGDEFAILIADADRNRGEEVARRLVDVLSRVRTTEEPAPVASIGACVVDDRTEAVEVALGAADSALYEVKRGGGNGMAFAADGERQWRPARSAIDILSRLETAGDALKLDDLLNTARELLGMDIAYATRHTSTEQIFEALVGDGESFGVGAGVALPLEMTYCEQILAGRLPRLMPDLRSIPLAAEMPVTESARVGAYVSVPVKRPDGQLHGTLCAAAHDARPDLTERDVQLLHLLARLLGDLHEREQRAVERERSSAATSALRALAAAVEARDHYTSEHSAFVLELAAGTARRMGLSESDIIEAEQVALLHDIGKLAIPDAILHKPGPLDDQEWDVMRTHPEAGARVVADIPELMHLADPIRAEHERWDGGGYPLGLAGEAIPVSSRIAFVCDAFHAMTSDRPYRPALDREVALQEIRDGAGHQFCPSAASALVAQLSIS